MRASFNPFGVWFTSVLAQNAIPLGLNKFVIDDAMLKYSLVFSNAFICKKPLCWGGFHQHKELGSFGFTSVTGKCYFTFTMLTIGEVMGLAMFTDEKVMTDPKRFMDIYVQKYKDVIKRLDK